MITRVIATVSKPLAVGLAIACLATATLAQQSVQGVPNAMQGFSQNRDKPVQISAGSLEVRDKDKTAVWTGEVKVVQGDTTMRAKTLTVYYDGEQGLGGATSSSAKAAVPAMRQATPGPGGNQSIRRLEAKGSVIVTQKDQTVTGESAVFDMKSNTVTMGGGVLLTQGQNALKGERLTVNLTTGISKVEVGQGGRVTGTFQGSKSDSGKGGSFLPGGSSPPAADATPADRREPGKPLRLNGFPLNSRPAG